MPVRNEAANIGRALAAVTRQQVDAPFEVIVADGCSTDETRAIVAGYAAADARVCLVDNSAVGIAQGLNAALAVARGSYVIRVDGHCEPSPGLFQVFLDRLRGGSCEAVGGRVDAVAYSRFGRAVAAAHNSRFGIGTAADHYLRRPAFADHVTHGAYLTERVRGLGGWDETFAVNEDVEFDYRYRRAGGRILLDPSVSSNWRVRENPRALASQYARYGFWKFRVLARHRRSLQLRWLAPPTLVAALALGLVTSWSVYGRWLLVAVAGCYLCFLAIASLTLAARDRWWLAPRIAAALAIMHLTWGGCFLASLVVSGVRLGRRC
jgi:succinoglycan biosynthesis protein ExoA